jgi:hypothetical protein
LVYEVVYCSECEKPIKSVPSWLGSVNVKFSCETCRQKHPRPFLGPDSVVPSRGGRRGAEDSDEDQGLVVRGEDAQSEDVPEDFADDDVVAEESGEEAVVE